MLHSLVDLLTCIDKKYHPKHDEFTVAAAFAGFDSVRNKYVILSFATGTKSIGVQQSACDINGNFLNDSHAEILARRALQRFMYKCWIMQQQNIVVLQDEDFPFTTSLKDSKRLKLKENWSIQMFISANPCGDSSIYEQRSDQNTIDKEYKSNHQFTGAKVFSTTVGIYPKLVKEDGCQTVGQLRFKPGRSDILPRNRSVSKSCTDKICKWIVTGLQGYDKLLNTR